MKTAIAVLIFVASCFGQFAPKVDRNLDIKGNPAFSPLGSGALASRPASCSVGQVWVCVGTGCTNANNIHLCSTANNWTVQGTSAAAGVNTFNTRNGDVTPQAGDYTAALVTNTPAGDIAAVTVQNALNELDTEKQAALGYTPVPNTRTVAGKALSSDVTLVKGDVGLGNVDNTSDANKPISTATQSALDGKQATITTATDVVGRSVTITAAGAGSPLVARTHASTVTANPFMGVQNASNTWLGGFLGSGLLNIPALTSGAAMFDDNGTLQKVTGTATDCVLVNGTSAACSGGSVTAGTGISVVGSEVAIDTAVVPTKAALQSGAALLLTTTSASPTTFTATMAPTLTAYTSGSALVWVPNQTCSGTVTLNVDTLGAKNVYEHDGTTAASCSSGLQYQLAYDSTLNASAGGWRKLQGGGTGNVVGPASAVDSTVAIYDSTTGKLLKSGTGCTITAGVLTCTGGFSSGDGTAQSGIFLPETTANGGTYSFRIYGAADQSADGCIIVSGQPGDDQILKGTATTATVDSKTCRVMAWEADATGGAGTDLDAATGTIATAQIEDGAVTTAKVSAALKTHTRSVTVFDPVAGDSGRVQFVLPGSTITRVWCNVKAATNAVINIEERAEGTPDTAGTAVLTSNLTCTTTGASTTLFSNAGIAARAPIALIIASVSGTPDTLRVHVEYTVD